MQSVDFKEFNSLEKKIEKLLEEIPESRRKLHERVAETIKKEVDAQIQKSGIKDTSGHVRERQVEYVGSGGGYAAVRATNKNTGKNSSGAITNYLEEGHRIREPSGKNKNYRPRIKRAYVNGYHFYKAARTSVESKAIAMAEEYAEKMLEELEK